VKKPLRAEKRMASTFHHTVEVTLPSEDQAGYRLGKPKSIRLHTDVLRHSPQLKDVAKYLVKGLKYAVSSRVPMTLFLIDSVNGAPALHLPVWGQSAVVQESQSAVVAKNHISANTPQEHKASRDLQVIAGPPGAGVASEEPVIGITWDDSHAALKGMASGPKIATIGITGTVHPGEPQVMGRMVPKPPVAVPVARAGAKVQVKESKKRRDTTGGTKVQRLADQLFSAQATSPQQAAAMLQEFLGKTSRSTTRPTRSTTGRPTRSKFVASKKVLKGVARPAKTQAPQRASGGKGKKLVMTL
jgi:hypothetical protein